jgi:branched-chain amino acid transport system permease protein
MKGRPNLYTNYSKESAIFSNNTQKIWFMITVVFAVILSFLASEYWILLLTTAFLISVACWGLNIVSGLAGQINLAHGFFIGIGTYASAIIGGVSSSKVIGYELDMLIWLPLSGIIAAFVGLVIAPITVKLKGLNLALVTLALVFIGSHVFSNFKSITGGAGLGRKVAKLELLGFDLESGISLGSYFLDKSQIIYLISLTLCIFTGLGVKNLVRSRAGRAFAAIRDGDIAAEAIGINIFRYKSAAFALSSFFAGISGAMFFTVSGGVEPGTFSLLYSIIFVAIVVIGGAGTVLGPLFGSFFYTLFPAFILVALKTFEIAEQSLPLNVGQLERILFGLFIILFLIFEPRGLWGIWFRLRNYFKAWPFSY